MLPDDKIQNVEHAQLQRNIEMLNRRKKIYDISIVTVGNVAHLTREDKNECLPGSP